MYCMDGHEIWYKYSLMIPFFSDAIMSLTFLVLNEMSCPVLDLLPENVVHKFMSLLGWMHCRNIGDPQAIFRALLSG